MAGAVLRWTHSRLLPGFAWELARTCLVAAAARRRSRATAYYRRPPRLVARHGRPNHRPLCGRRGRRKTAGQLVRQVIAPFPATACLPARLRVRVDARHPCLATDQRLPRAAPSATRPRGPVRLCGARGHRLRCGGGPGAATGRQRARPSLGRQRHSHHRTFWTRRALGGGAFPAGSIPRFVARFAPIPGGWATAGVEPDAAAGLLSGSGGPALVYRLAGLGTWRCSGFRRGQRRRGQGRRGRRSRGRPGPHGAQAGLQQPGNHRHAVTPA